MKPMVFLLPMGLYSFNLLATSQEQPTHINGHGGAFCKVLEEEEVVVVMQLVQGQGDGPVQGGGGGDMAGMRTRWLW